MGLGWHIGVTTQFLWHKSCCHAVKLPLLPPAGPHWATAAIAPKLCCFIWLFHPKRNSKWLQRMKQIKVLHSCMSQLTTQIDFVWKPNFSKFPMLEDYLPPAPQDAIQLWSRWQPPHAWTVDASTSGSTGSRNAVYVCLQLHSYK